MVSDGETWGAIGREAHAVSDRRLTHADIAAWAAYSADLRGKVLKGYERLQSPSAARKSPLGRRKRIYRRLGQMFLRWAETEGAEI